MLHPQPYVTFRIADCRHGLPLSCVDRALRAAAITPVPDPPEELMGVLDVHGRILPVLSLARRFGLPQKAIAPQDHFLMARMGERTVVLPVHEVLEVVERVQLTAGDAVIPGLERLAGLGRLDDGLVVIHDLERFFSPEEWRAVDRSIAAAAR